MARQTCFFLRVPSNIGTPGVTPSSLRKNPISGACTWVKILLGIAQDLWPYVIIGTKIDLKTDSLWCLQAPVLWPQNDQAHAELR